MAVLDLNCPYDQIIRLIANESIKLNGFYLARERAGRVNNTEDDEQRGRQSGVDEDVEQEEN